MAGKDKRRLTLGKDTDMGWRDELIELGKRDPEELLRPELVVKAARRKTSALHSHFCWDDTKAAHEHRLWQARQLIRRVTVLGPDPAKQEVPDRVFVSLVPDRKDGGGYRPLETVMADEEWRQMLLRQALSDHRRYQAKYQKLAEVSGVIEAQKAVNAMYGEPEAVAEAAGK